MSEELSIDLYLADDEDEDDFPLMPPLGGDEEVKLEPEETIAGTVKSSKKKKWRNRIKNLDSKQTIN